MKYLKTITPFFFQDVSHQQIIDLLDDDYPISLKYNQELIERIYQKYPLISKTEIAIIVRATFYSIRELLILGKILNFNKLFFDTKLKFFAYRRSGHIFSALKVQISTPPYLRKNVQSK